ncbi:MAG TPA: hypothetical protein VEL05_08135 [Candidatus Acidoferrum sp.]|nr:hypothetical protein [Candidatus Acidoferrum sp.]
MERRARRISLTMPVVDAVLDAAEATLVDRALGWLRGAAPHDAAELADQLGRVRALAAAFVESPSLSLPSRFGGVDRDEEWFAGSLLGMDPVVGDLALPEKAVLARGFLSAKIALLRSFIAALAPGAPGQHRELCAGFAHELAQSIDTAIAIEILIDLRWDAGIGDETRARAAHQLILIWDRALELEIDDFCPLLESAWRARSRVAALYGALLGTAEYMSLVMNDCPPEFLDFFCEDGPEAVERRAAFEEFLFGMTSEELGRVRAAMQSAGRAVVDAAFVERVLGRRLEAARELDDPYALYRSYRRRRTAAEFRRLTGAPGPLRVAEAYLMIYLLHRS